MNNRFPDKTAVFAAHNYSVLPGCGGQYEDITLTVEDHQNGLSVRVRADSAPLTFIVLHWTFREEEKRKDRIRIYGDAWERGGGELSWRGIEPDRCMPWFVLVSNGSDAEKGQENRLTECFGVKVRPNAMCFWQYSAESISLWMDVRSGGAGVLLGGRTLDVCEVVFRTYESCSAFEAGQQFCKVMCSDPLTTQLPVYGFNNWYYAYGESSEKDILRDADMASELCEGIQNRPFVVIDDGWTIHPKNGPWSVGNAHFPDMKGLAEKIKQKGSRPGLWVRYIYNMDNACGLPESWQFKHAPGYLDPSLPEVLDYIRETTKCFTDWGYELIKYDCSTQDILGRRGYRVKNVIAENGWRFANASKTSAEILKDFYRTVFEAAGRDTVLIGCAVITHLSAGLVHLARTGADVNGRSWDITRQMGVNTLAFRMMTNRAFFAADADCIGYTGAFSWAQAEKWLELLAKSGTPLFVSCNPDRMDAGAKEALRLALRQNAEQTDTLIPLDWMENQCPARWLLNGKEMRVNWFGDDIPLPISML